MSTIISCVFIVCVAVKAEMILLIISSAFYFFLEVSHRYLPVFGADSENPEFRTE